MAVMCWVGRRTAMCGTGFWSWMKKERTATNEYWERVETVLKGGLPDRAPLTHVWSLHKPHMAKVLGRPPANDFSYLKREFGEKITLIGNADLDELTRFTPERVYETNRQMMEIGKPGGRYMADIDTMVEDFIPIANYQAFVDAVRDAGAYRGGRRPTRTCRPKGLRSVQATLHPSRRYGRRHGSVRARLARTCRSAPG